MFSCHVFHVSLEHAFFLLRVNLFKGYHAKFPTIDSATRNVRNCIDKWDGSMETVKKTQLLPSSRYLKHDEGRR